MKNTKKTFIASLCIVTLLFGVVSISALSNPPETFAKGKSVNSQRVAAQKPKPIMRGTKAGTVEPAKGVSVKKVGTREGGQPIYEVKTADGDKYVTGSANASKALNKVAASCKKWKNCDNPSCHNVAEKDDKNSKYYKDLNPGSNTPTRVTPITPTTPPIRVINTGQPTTILGPGVTTPLTLPGTPAAIIPGLPVGVTGPIDIEASIFPNIVNEGYKCKISYEVDNAVSCVSKTGNTPPATLFDSNDGSFKTGNVDVDPGTHTIECINDDNVPAQKVLTCVANVDTRED